MCRRLLNYNMEKEEPFEKGSSFGPYFPLEIFRFRLRNAVVQTARNISERRKLIFNLPPTVHAVGTVFFALLIGM